MTRGVRRLLQAMLDGERLLQDGRRFVLSTSRRVVHRATVDQAMQLEYVARVFPPRAYVLMPRGVMALAREKS